MGTDRGTERVQINLSVSICTQRGAKSTKRREK